MKLRNKLIPLASCLTIGATVAPMISACGTSEFVDLKDGFTPTISRLAVEDYKLTVAKAEQVYFNAVSENPEVFAQDLNWTMSTLLRTAAENPVDSSGSHHILGDESTSVIDYAKQYVKNVKVGKTVINYTTQESEVVSKELYTLSFDLVREQQFTWKHDYEVASGQSVQATNVGTTLFKISFNNVPFNFCKTSPELEMVLNADYDYSDYDYDGHLGRILTEKREVLSYLPTKWLLSSAVIFDASGDDRALKYMVDPWSVSYEYNTNDTMSYTYNDVTEETTYAENYSGTYDDYEKISEGDYAATRIVSMTFGSHYLSDIKPIAEKE